MPTFIKSPITFTLAKGNGRYLLVNLSYNTQGGEFGSLILVTPDSKVFPGLPVTSLLTAGNGKYTIPFGSGGIPAGAQLQSLNLEQIANYTDCSKHSIDFTDLQIARRFVGLSSDPAAFCNNSCGDAR